MPFSVPSQVKALVAETVVINRRSPFTVDMPIAVQSAGTPLLWGAKHPGESDTVRYCRIQPGAAVADSTFDVPATMVLHDHAAAALTAKMRLRVIVVKNRHLDGVGTIITRMGNDEDPSTGEFCQTDTNTIQLGFATLAGDIFEVYSLADADIAAVTGAILVADTTYNATCYDFMVTDVLVQMEPAAAH